MWRNLIFNKTSYINSGFYLAQFEWYPLNLKAMKNLSIRYFWYSYKRTTKPKFLIFGFFMKTSKLYSKPSHTSKMELFPKMVNGFQLTVFCWLFSWNVHLRGSFRFWIRTWTFQIYVAFLYIDQISSSTI